MTLDVPVLDDFDEEPLVSSGWASYGDYKLVGNDEVTNQYCGVFLHYKGCLRTELHNHTDLFGKNYAEMIFLHKSQNWCNKPSCPVCFKSGWAVRQAHRVEMRLKELVNHYGEAEHIVCSVPSRDFYMEFKPLRRKAVKILKSRGVIGGCLIFHAFRYNHTKHWYFSPHWHILGVVRGGFARCRHCKFAVCMGKGNFYKCDGFEARTRRLFEKDGYIVKVFGERKSIFGTAWYQLNHASLKIGVNRFHVCTWFGVASYRKLKVTIEKHKVTCPICMHDLVTLRYFGSKDFVTDRLSPDYVQDSFEKYKENGRPVGLKFNLRNIVAVALNIDCARTFLRVWRKRVFILIRYRKSGNEGRLGL